MTYRILIPKKVHESGIQLLEAAGCEIVRPPDTRASTLREYAADADAILARTEPITDEVIEQAARLKVIARHGAGYDNISLEKASEMGITVTNVPLGNTNAVAELVVTLIMAASRNLVGVNREFAKGNYEIRDAAIGSEVEGKTLGIVGYGHIGRLVSKKCRKGLCMKIRVYDPFLDEATLENGVEAVENLEAFLAECDYVSLHVPLMEATRNMIGTDQFRQMKENCVLINASRGGVVDEKALLEALDDGEIGMAALDVFEEEPPSSDHPLIAHDRVIATPHLGAQTTEAMENLSVAAAEEILRVLSGEAPLNRVN
ncbi:hydroxyacid dehydrogenase [Salinicoccus sp. ID82-1]|uniref:D-lactate dehydrogenase n=2 Tax=Staphylococcaceae TaxID=90964 RepID=A0A558AT00_9STAP|nr:hydroxyacid dehydrogenase [Salinicoccus sp. ID82-1]TVT27392.1 hydroxyacid dehydrogenase [Salinicoccus cyprini]